MFHVEGCLHGESLWPNQQPVFTGFIYSRGFWWPFQFPGFTVCIHLKACICWLITSSCNTNKQTKNKKVSWNCLWHPKSANHIQDSKTVVHQHWGDWKHFHWSDQLIKVFVIKKLSLSGRHSSQGLCVVSRSSCQQYCSLEQMVL